MCSIKEYIVSDPYICQHQEILKKTISYKNHFVVNTLPMHFRVFQNIGLLKNKIEMNMLYKLQKRHVRNGSEQNHQFKCS